MIPSKFTKLTFYFLIARKTITFDRQNLRHHKKQQEKNVEHEEEEILVMISMDIYNVKK